MSQRRMFSKEIIDSDAFLTMPVSAQNLYFHLGMRADDDGFVNNTRSIMALTHATDDDIKILLAKSYVIEFDSGVIVIKHWRLNNLLRNDRYVPTKYTEEARQIFIKEDGAYTLDENKAKKGLVYQMTTKWKPNDNQTVPQDSIGKYSIDKDSIGKDKEEDCKEEGKKHPTLEEVTSYCNERKNHVDPQRFIDYYTSQGWKVGKNPMKNWKACVRTWEAKDRVKTCEEQYKEFWKK